MARMFKTKSGEEYELLPEKYEKLKLDFPTKDVDAVLYTMRTKLNVNSAKYAYTMRGMYTAIRVWLKNSKDVEMKYTASHTPFKFDRRMTDSEWEASNQARLKALH